MPCFSGSFIGCCRSGPSAGTTAGRLGGGLLASLLWEIGRQLLSQFLVGASYTAYGVVGSFILMMLWFNYASMVLLYGAEFVALGAQQDGRDQRRGTTKKP